VDCVPCWTCEGRRHRRAGAPEADPAFPRDEGFEIPAGEDDTAVWSDHGSYTVASCDMAVEGVHFDLSWMPAEDAGWRALALALGDLAAKGATPAWALTSIAVPKTWQVENFVGLYKA